MHTILIVDAPEGDASVLASALRVEGFRVVLAATVRDAREVLKSKPVTVTVLDLMLRTDAGANGLEFARELRGTYPSMKVILTSSYYLSERQLERADCGVSGFVPKPYDIGEVVNFITTKAASSSSPPSSRRLWHAEPASGLVDCVPSAAPAPLLEAAGSRGRR